MEIKILNEEQYNEVIKNGKVLVDFSATWCGPCQMMAPHIEKLINNYPEINFVKIDVDQFNHIAALNRISAVPTLIYFENGQIKKTSVGYLSYSEIEKIIK